MNKLNQMQCPDCDLAQTTDVGGPRDKIVCVRCDATLLKRSRFSLRHRNEILCALTITSVILFLLAITFPIVNINFSGIPNRVSILKCVVDLYHQNMKLVSILIFLTSVLAPFFQIFLNIIYLWNKDSQMTLQKNKYFKYIKYWSAWAMLDVYLLGILIASVKISENAIVIFNVAFWCICFLVVLLILANNLLQKNLNELCIVSHHNKNLSHSIALLISAIFMMFPANLLPIMEVTNLGDSNAQTILGGIIYLALTGSWPLSIIIFIASLLVPIVKVLILLGLVISVKFNLNWNPRMQTKLYRASETIGKWSMVDIYVAGLMAVLIQFQELATSIFIGNGAIAFGAAVVLTIMAVEKFDPKLIWQKVDHG